MNNPDQQMPAVYARAQEQYNQTGKYEDTGNALYQYLTDERMMNPTNEDKHILYARAQEAIITDLQEQRSKPGANLGEMNKQVYEILKYYNPLVKIAAKKLAVLIHLECKKRETNISIK